MKLFSKEEVFVPQKSMEEFLHQYRHSSVVSTEAVSDYLSKAKDVFGTFYNRNFNNKLDEMAVDALVDRWEVEKVIKRLDMVKIGTYTVSKPENFKGKYVDYSESLLKAAKQSEYDAKNGLENLKVTIAMFINEHTEEKQQTFLNKKFYMDLKKSNDSVVKMISGYFPKIDNSVKAEIRDILKTVNDIPSINKNVAELGTVVTSAKVSEVIRLANEVAELIDVFLQHNKQSALLNKPNSVKTDLTEAIYIVSKAVENYANMYANLLSFYKGCKSMNEQLIRLANM